jgi:hypothetical protein
MSPKISMVFAAVALTLATASLQSASANYAPCIENPEAPGCPMARTPPHESAVAPLPPRHVRHAHNYRAHRPGAATY